MVNVLTQVTQLILTTRNSITYDQLNMADAYSNGGITSTALKVMTTHGLAPKALINGGYDFQAVVGMVQASCMTDVLLLLLTKMSSKL